MLRGILTVVLIVAPTVVSAQQFDVHPPGRDPYRNWVQPNVGISCCNQQDCAPRHECRVQGRLGWFEHGVCTPLPEELRLELPPDPEAAQQLAELGTLHVCRAVRWLQGLPTPVFQVRCWYRFETS